MSPRMHLSYKGKRQQVRHAKSNNGNNKIQRNTNLPHTFTFQFKQKKLTTNNPTLNISIGHTYLTYTYRLGFSKYYIHTLQIRST
jgi:hypothetical protein